MAAAEYYNAAPLRPSPHQSPYIPSQQPQAPAPQNYSLGATSQPGPPPPPYQPVELDSRPSVHFAPSPRPSQQSSSKPPPEQVYAAQGHRPSFSNSPNSLSPHDPRYHQSPKPQNAPFQQRPHPYPGPPPFSPQLAGLRPQMNGNQSMYDLGTGYASDPERRRRRRSHDPPREERESRDRPRKNRSRSTNADGFLGAAGGGLIGDMIFPGLGTVGGALAGWIGGKDYGRHRKSREDKLDREQHDWERKYRSRSNSDEYRFEGRERRSYERHKSEY